MRHLLRNQTCALRTATNSTASGRRRHSVIDARNNVSLTRQTKGSNPLSLLESVAEYKKIMLFVSPTRRYGERYRVVIETFAINIETRKRRRCIHLRPAPHGDMKTSVAFFVRPCDLAPLVNEQLNDFSVLGPDRPQQRRVGVFCTQLQVRVRTQ